MGKIRQSFKNHQDKPIYVSVEPWPECFELEPGEVLTLIYEASESEVIMDVDVINEQELVLWPNGKIDDIEFLINGEPGAERSWTFKHPRSASAIG